jgi:hypothetical protein
VKKTKPRKEQAAPHAEVGQAPWRGARWISRHAPR